MDIHRNAATAHVVTATMEERDWLRRYLTLDPPNRFTRYPIVLCKGRDLRFGAGLLKSVHKTAMEEGVVINIADARENPPPLDKKADTSWLRDYQHDALDMALSKKTGILWLPTGSGKTEIAIALANSVKCEWLFLTHRAILADQAAKRYKLRTGRTAGRAKNGVWTGIRNNERFTVATFQSLWRHRRKKGIQDLFSNIGGIIVDEAHIAAARTYYELIMMASNAYYRIGLSGTPLQRTDNKAAFVVASLGPPIFRLEPNELIEKGVIAKPNITMVDVWQPLAKRPCEYDEVYDSHVVNSRVRNGVIANFVRQCQKPALVFVRKIDHAHRLKDLIAANGLECELVTGSDWDSSRERKIQHLQKGRTDVLVATVVFQEGVDIPELRTVVIASGGSSVIAALQRIGRGMRVTDTKSACIILDINDKGEYFLERQSRKRKKAYRADGHKINFVSEDFFSKKQ